MFVLLKKSSFLIVLLLTSFVINCRAALNQAQLSQIADYKALNDAETHLPNYKDSPEKLQIKIAQLQLINASRQKSKLNPVQLDIFACRYANFCSEEAVKGGFSGHYNLLGQSPMIRWAEVGGQDHIAENNAEWSGVSLSNLGEIVDYLKQSHSAMMAEKSPNDAHKRTILDKYHNYVGIGFASGNDKIVYYEEFIDKYLIFNQSESLSGKGLEVQLLVKPIDDTFSVYATMTFILPKPKPMSAKAINAIGFYSDFSENNFSQTWPWDLPAINQDGFTPFNFLLTKKGYYYVHIYLSDKPFKSGKADTKGKIQSSGIVIKYL